MEESWQRALYGMAAEDEVHQPTSLVVRLWNGFVGVCVQIYLRLQLLHTSSLVCHIKRSLITWRPRHGKLGDEKVR